jgi:predicted secreted acid phosphatase
MTARRSLQRLFAATALVALLAASARAADCPAVPEPHIPPMPVSPFNIDLVKKALRSYQKGDYAGDLAAVYTMARNYVDNRAGQVSNPAVVLDIDETSLSNWPNIDADDFGFILKGPCTLEKNFACGFGAWVDLGAAKEIPPALDFFRAARAKNVAVLFVTARKESQRDITVKNLRAVGYDGWTKLVLLPDDDKRSAQAYKTAARAALAKDYTIIANIGDQLSDLAGGSAECTFKLPNPFYFIE